MPDVYAKRSAVIDGATKSPAQESTATELVVTAVNADTVNLTTYRKLERTRNGRSFQVLVDDGAVTPMSSINVSLNDLLEGLALTLRSMEDEA